MALEKQGFDVLLAGRQLSDSLPVSERSYRTIRFRLWFTKGPLFYATYNLRLMWFLLTHRCQLLFANDLDTLLANYVVSLIKRIPLVYDSHEYYTGVPELENRPFIRGIWKKIERTIFPKLGIVITVNESIALLYEKEYGKKPLVIRNVPFKPPAVRISAKRELRKKLQLPENNYLLILQGAGINIERGAEEAVECMKYLEGASLLIVGGGDVVPFLKELVNLHHLENKIIFKPRMAYQELLEYTAAADLGLTLDKNTNVNYRFSLPNKIFDYIHAGIPVLASRLPEVERIVKQYEIGTFIDNHDPAHIASKIESIRNNPEQIAQWQMRLPLAAQALNWEEESKKFPDLKNEYFR